MTPRLEAAYAEPHRRYHTADHIAHCLALLGQVVGLSDEERRLLTWAIWWHDAVYDPKASDNEARSAAMARKDLAGLGAGAAEREEVARLILLTAGHDVETGDRLGAILVTIDLSILGAAPGEYDAYVRAVRAEYDDVPEPLWRTGRARVLQKFLDTPELFPDRALGAGWEAQAKANLARELESLSPA